MSIDYYNNLNFGMDNVDCVLEDLLDFFDIFQLIVSLEEEYGITVQGTEIFLVIFSSLENISKLSINKGV